MPDAETVLCLRTCNADMTSSSHRANGFVWPGEGEVVEAPDWRPDAECGHGLHGLLWGEGHGNMLSLAEDAIWLVFEADAENVVDLGGKVKVPRATVLKVGDRETVTAWLAERAPGRAIVGLTATAGDCGAATAGYAGTATVGYAGTATVGDCGAATAGVRGTATAGDDGTATAGYGGTATAGYGGTATAGVRGTVVIRRWDGKRYRWVLGEIGETRDESGALLAPDVAYRLNDDGEFRRVIPVETHEGGRDGQR